MCNMNKIPPPPTGFQYMHRKRKCGQTDKRTDIQSNAIAANFVGRGIKILVKTAVLRNKQKVLNLRENGQLQN